MASWFYRIFLISLFGATGFSPALAQQNTEVIEPDLDRRAVKVARIDNEFIEFGAYYGVLNIEDFDSSEMWNARIAFHINEHFFIEGSYGQAEGGSTTAEDLFVGAQFIPPDEKDYKSWDVSMGWNIFPNESWLFGRAFKTDVYLLTGLGVTDFGGDKWATLNAGLGYHVFLTDWLIWRVEVRDHIFNRNINNQDDTTNNVETSMGFGFYF